MKDKFFIDTNILIYSFDKSEPTKQKIAKEIISKAFTGYAGCISYQVIQEFLNVATQKFEKPLAKNDCYKFMTNVLEPLCEIFPSMALYKEALEIQEGWQYSFYDSLIISAAIRANCNILYTEDLQHEQRIRNLLIINPFIQQ
ncbi:PIN domain-containing protein [candidate division KSB1 bacterium]|nr:PIN domain-containing protein [candidate division KSB1 bacterium]